MKVEQEINVNRRISRVLTPSAGNMIVNGVEIDGATREEWQKNIAYIPQQPYIFPFIKDNICFYETNTTDEEVERVMNEVGLRSLVTSLPNGMYERIGEGGRMLSGGQEQRVAMARALLSKKPIILLDEPTAHLDIETEFEIKQAMLRLFEGKLVFLATHRLHWMKQMDHILILNKGKMIESGTYEELVKNEALHFRRKEGIEMSNWIKPYIQQNKGRMTVTIFLGLLGVSSGAMLLFISGYLISKSALRPENVMAVYVPIVATRAFSIGQAVFHYVERLVGHDVVLRILEKMRTKLYGIVEPQALFFRSRFQTGDMLGVLSEDIEHLQNLYLRTIFPSILALVVYSIFVLVIGTFDVVFALIAACMLAIIVFFFHLYHYF